MVLSIGSRANGALKQTQKDRDILAISSIDSSRCALYRHVPSLERARCAMVALLWSPEFARKEVN